MAACSRYSTPLFSLIILTIAIPAHAFDPNAGLFGVDSTNGSLTDEIRCYGLPYGGIGFASHILTYYTIGMIASKRSPWMPWRENTFWLLDFVLALLGLIITIITSSLTIDHCRSRWQFVALAVWKLSMSITLGVTSMVAAFAVRRRLKGDGGIEYNELRRNTGRMGYAEGSRSAEDLNYTAEDRNYTVENGSYIAENRTPANDSKHLANPAWWILFYAPGSIVGLVGLLSIVVETFSTVADVRTITIVFGSVCGGGALLTLVFCLIGTFWFNKDEDDTKNTVQGFALGIPSALLIALCLAIILFAFYSDWILGAIAGNLAGFPSEDNSVLYWSYFAAKRLPLFTF